jgi:tripartite-type tricarboxylate transporter receptor subunit TctC
MNRNRRSLLAEALACAAVGIVPSASLAQAGKFPTRPVRIILPFLPGGANDGTLRLVTERLSAMWGQPVIVEYKPGASSIIGTDLVAKSSPDGYTLLATIMLIVQNPSLRKKLPYDPAALTPVTQLNRQQLAIYVRPDLPIKSVSELIAYAKDRPGVLNFASWGVGSTPHILLEKLQLDSGVKMTHVAYKGGAEINKAVLSGEADVGLTDLLSPDPLFKAGRLRVIGVTGPQRLATMPDIQTLGEAGVNGFDGYSWIGLFAPSRTPPSVVRDISDAINHVQADPALDRRLREDFLVYPSATTPEQFRQIYERDRETWAGVIQATKISLD